MQELLYIYIIVINIIAVIATVHDKRAALRHKWRVSENTLLMIAILSGCVVMYTAMRIIHHKTKKKKFMIGIPVIFLIELFASVVVCKLLCVF